LHGGGQEKGWRAGTLNVAGIVGTGAAASVAQAELAAEPERVTVLRDLLEKSLLARIQGARVNAFLQPRLPNVSSMAFLGAPADAVLARMPGVAASDGSACASGSPSPSHVLLAMGQAADEAESTVRFSLGFGTTQAHIELAADAAERAVREVRVALGFEESAFRWTEELTSNAPAMGSTRGGTIGRG
jgi:cysteine desulfurase